MNASIMGAPAPNPLQALSRLLSSGKPSHTIPTARSYPTGAFQLVAGATGITAYLDGLPVAWIVPGFHEGQTDNKPKRCDFVDVAYHHQAREGIHLETADFLTLDEAVTFITGIFGGVA